MKKIRIEKYKGKVLESLSKPACYFPSQYGLSDTLTGRNIKISIIDSGCPDHKDIKVKGQKATFCDNDRILYDSIGHSTILSGIICANDKKSLLGIAPASELYFAKVIDGLGRCSFSSLVAAVLWSIVKKVDIILIALGTSYDYTVLHNAIQKAVDRDICVVSASGNSIKDGEVVVDFPAKYKEVFSVAVSLKNKEKNKILQSSIDFVLPSEKLYTTFLNNQYIKVNGSSISAAMVCGLVSLLLEKGEYKNIRKEVYSQLLSVLK